MLYQLYRSVCSLIIRVLNIELPWSSGIHPTIGEVIVFSLAAVLIIKFVRGLLE